MYQSHVVSGSGSAGSGRGNDRHDGEKQRTSHNSHDDHKKERRRRDYDRRDDYDYDHDKRDSRDKGSSSSSSRDRHHRSKYEESDRRRRDRSRSRSRSRERYRGGRYDDNVSKEPADDNVNNHRESSASRSHGHDRSPGVLTHNSTTSVGSNEYKNVNSGGAAVAGITMKLAPPPAPKPSLPLPSTTTPLVQKSAKVAAIFNDDSDDEPEEMPPEAKMRMKNVGRDTPTSAGPNSFGKTKLGFCNTIHLNEQKLEPPPPVPVRGSGSLKLPKWK